MKNNPQAHCYVISTGRPRNEEWSGEISFQSQIQKRLLHFVLISSISFRKFPTAVEVTKIKNQL